MSDVTETDLLIVGAGPAGLNAGLQARLFGLTVHLFDALDRPGGQCAVYYADKPIHDMPGLPGITAQDLTDRLVGQLTPLGAGMHLGETVLGVAPNDGGGRLKATTDKGRTFRAGAVLLALGDGAFRPKQLDLPGPGMVAVPGLPDLPDGARRDGTITVDTERFATTVAGLFAIGDGCIYPGRLRLLVSAFHEGAMAVQAIRRHLAEAAGPGGVTPTAARRRRARSRR